MTATVRSVTRRLRRLTAAVALVAQSMAMVAPLVDVHPASMAQSALGVHLDSSSGLPGNDQHDASRCPGCIAQMIHAAPVPPARVSLVAFELRLASEAVSMTRPPAAHPSPHRSRAPPLQA